MPVAWSFRRRIKLGPVNVNLSRSGIGVSAGVGPIRTGVDAKGRRYTSVRGPFGLYNRQYHKANPSAPLQGAENPNIAAVKDAVIVLLFSLVIVLIGFNGAVAPGNQGWLTLFAFVTGVPAVIGIVGYVTGKDASDGWLLLNATLLKVEKWLLLGALILLFLMAASSGGKRRR